MRFGFPFLLAAAQVLWGQPGGTTPRANGSDYPAHASAAGVSLGAIAIAPALSRKILGKDIDHAGYIVIEAAVYPEAGQIGIEPNDFSLRIGTATVGPVNPDTIIAAIQPAPKNPKLPGNVSVYSTETIGYESGGYGRRGGVYTASGVGVGVGDPRVGGGPPLSSGKDVDLSDFRRQLEAKALPATKTSSPVAGYLYFPKPAAKQKTARYEVVYEAPSGPVRVSVPLPSK